jgi:ecotin
MPSLADYHAPYPDPAPGQERKVIYLPPLDSDMEENHMRVQLIAGRHEDCEDGRLYHLTGIITEDVVEGWGYSYYVVTLGDIYAAHRTPADTENATSFVAMFEKPMLRYNSKLPIVVYVPEGAEVHYRVWMDEAARAAGASVALAPPASAALMTARNYNDLEELDDGRHSSVQHAQTRNYPQEEGHAKHQEEYPEPSGTRDIPANVHAYEERYTGSRPLQAEEAAEHRRGIPPAEQQEYVEVKEAPVLESTEKANHRGGVKAAPQEARESETERYAPRKSDPSSEHRHRSSSKPRKHSSSEAVEPKPRERGLSSTELSPVKSAPKSATERSPSSKSKSHNESTNSGRRGSSTSSRDKKEDKDTYEKKAKNFWNRARGSSKSKSSSPKKEGSKVDQWSEM